MDLSAFHFLRPWLLLGIPVSLILAWLFSRRSTPGLLWQRVCDAELLPHLLVHQHGLQPAGTASLIGIVGVLASIALAGPTWSKLEQPVFRTQSARVIVLDVSQSMAAQDLKPSRLVRARFKITDILHRPNTGQTGLIAFAGDAFIVAPLTDDTRTIENLLPALSTQTIPIPGSRADLALDRAREMIARSGSQANQVLLITDDAGDDFTRDALAKLRELGVSVSVLGVGSTDGAPIPGEEGGFIKDAQGNIAIARVDHSGLRALAGAGGGQYSPLTTDDRDLDRVLMDPGGSRAERKPSAVAHSTAHWQDRGIWLVLLLIPLAALAFRRGWLFVMVFLIAPWPAKVYAVTWDDLWLRTDQQAARALRQQDYDRASALAQNPQRKGSALYRQGEFDAARQAFARTRDAEAHYNRANALTRSAKYQQALEAYDAALKQQPEHADARFNRDLVARLQPPPQPDSKQSDSSKEQKDQDKKKDKGSQQQQSDQSKQSDSKSDSQDQPQADSQSENQSDTDAKPKKGAQSEPTPQQAKAEPNQDAVQKNGKSEEENQKKDAPVESNEVTAQAKTEPSDQDRELEQWLRRIPDDPGGLLRQKFLLDYRRRGTPRREVREPW